MSNALPRERQLRKGIEDIQKNMDLINTNLPILKNIADSETGSLLNKRIPISFTRYLFNKTHHTIMNSVKSVEESTILMFSKVAAFKDKFLVKLDDTITNVKGAVNEAVESVTDKTQSVVTCVLVTMYFFTLALAYLIFLYDDIILFYLISNAALF